MISLFVYGTLRRPIGGPASDTHYHDRVASLIESAEPAVLERAELRDFGAYPGVLPGEGVVAGELFTMPDKAFDVTDPIEGHPDFYVRTIERVATLNGTQRDAWVYWAPQGLGSEGALVASGDWFDRPRAGEVQSIEQQLAADRARLIEEMT